MSQWAGQGWDLVFLAWHAWSRASTLWVGVRLKEGAQTLAMLAWNRAFTTQSWWGWENLVAYPSWAEIVVLDWELERKGGALSSWLHLPRVDILSHWTGRQCGRGAGRDPDAPDLLFLPRFSRFSWINVSPLSVCPLGSFQKLLMFSFVFIIFTSYGCFPRKESSELLALLFQKCPLFPTTKKVSFNSQSKVQGTWKFLTKIVWQLMCCWEYNAAEH